MKFIELNNQSREELTHAVEGLKAKLLKLNFDMADNKVKDFSQLKKTRKDIARILTLLKSQNEISKS